MIRKRSDGGVISSRFAGSEKKSQASVSPSFNSWRALNVNSRKILPGGRSRKAEPCQYLYEFVDRDAIVLELHFDTGARMVCTRVKHPIKLNQ